MNFAITEESFVEFCLIDMNVIIIQFPCVILHDPGPSGFNQVSNYILCISNLIIIRFNVSFRTKGQLITKCIFGIFNSSKKGTNKIEGTPILKLAMVKR